MRLALYSHDAVGLGHLRRNLAIARSLGQVPGTSTLIVSGMREAAAFPTPPGLDYLTLPAYAKDAAGAYRPRFLRTTLASLVALRSSTIRAAHMAYEPDVLIVDKHPLGLYGELEPALDSLAASGTRCVLGLRDVLDRPDRTRAEWAAAGSDRAVHERFAQVWVYGDPRVYDLVRECSLGDAVRERARYTGYLGTGRQAAATDGVPGPGLELPEGRTVVCLVGGGQDGFGVAEAFARAPMPARTHGVVVAGPLMAGEERRALHRCAGPHVQVVDFLPEPAPLIRRADAVVAMGGYNTVCELLALAKRTLLVPRIAPREEQLIRARRLERRGLVDVLLPAQAGPSALGGWLAQAERAPARRRGAIDLSGLERLPSLLADAVAALPIPTNTRRLARVA